MSLSKTYWHSSLNFKFKEIYIHYEENSLFIIKSLNWMILEAEWTILNYVWIVSLMIFYNSKSHISTYIPGYISRNRDNLTFSGDSSGSIE